MIYMPANAPSELWGIRKIAESRTAIFSLGDSSGHGLPTMIGGPEITTLTFN